MLLAPLVIVLHNKNGVEREEKGMYKSHKKREKKGEYGVNVSPYWPTKNMDPFFLLWSINSTGKSLEQDHLPWPARDQKN